jgi:hypothetical protein
VAIAVENRNKSAATTTSPSTTAFTVTAGGSPLFVFVAWTDVIDVSSVTYAGAAMTLVTGSYATNDGWPTRVAAYVKAEPAINSNNVVVTWSANPTSGAQVYFVSTTGGDITTIYRTVSIEQSGTDPGLTLSNAVSGDLIFNACMMATIATITFGAGETSTNTETDDILGFNISAGVSTKTATGGDTVNITETPSHYGECVFAAIPAAGGQTLSAAVGNLALTGIAAVFRVGATMFLRYRK